MKNSPVVFSGMLVISGAIVGCVTPHRCRDDGLITEAYETASHSPAKVKAAQEAIDVYCSESCSDAKESRKWCSEAKGYLAKGKEPERDIFIKPDECTKRGVDACAAECKTTEGMSPACGAACSLGDKEACEKIKKILEARHAREATEAAQYEQHQAEQVGNVLCNRNCIDGKRQCLMACINQVCVDTCLRTGTGMHCEDVCASQGCVSSCGDVAQQCLRGCAK